MELVYNVLVVLHLVCWAIVLGGWLIRVREPQVVTGMAHGAAGALVIGVILTGIASASDAVSDPNNAKIAVKLVVALIVTALAFMNMKKPAPNPAAHVVGGLTVVNVALAVLW